MTSSPPPSLSPGSSPNSHSSGERSGQKLDGYFPEVLAADLEFSKAVFASRNMSAGAPTATLASDMEAVPEDIPSCGKFLLTVPYHTGSARTPSLRPIDERNSHVSFVDQPVSQFDESDSDVDSLPSTQPSCRLVPPVIPLRDSSIGTAATSLTSTIRRSSSVSSARPNTSRERSWIDGESDVEESNLAALSPRPSTPQEYTLVSGDVLADDRKPHRPRVQSRHSHQKAASVGGTRKIMQRPRRKISNRSADSTLRRLSTYPKFEEQPRELRDVEKPMTVPRSLTPKPERQLYVTPCPPRHAVAGKTMQSVLQPDAFPEPSPTNEYSDSDDGVLHIDPPSWARPSTIYIQPSPPPSPLPTVQSYLDNCSSTYNAHFTSDEPAKAVPLPPDVVETLRVSIACFPETMLLSSSLTVETIRSYSRKVRHPSLEITRPAASEPRVPIWKKFASYKRSSGTSQDRKRDSRGSDPSSLPSSPSATSLEPPKPWLSLKNVFGCCSDYISDALYAHIVTYNYVSALVPRQGPPKPPSSPGARQDRGHDGHTNDIPKKAASLLGIGKPPNPVQLSNKGLTKKVSMPFGRRGVAGTDELIRSAKHLGPSSAAHDIAMRDIQAGLMRCIARLVATAKLMAETGSGDDRLVEGEVREGDVLFTRSLCEIVRLLETRMD